MQTIPLYDPICKLPAPPIAELHTTHWRVEQLRTQEFLAEWLGVENWGGVLLFDRATHAIRAAIDIFGLGKGLVVIPRETYRAAIDAAHEAFQDVELWPGADILSATDPGRVYIPTWLWGQWPQNTQPPLHSVFIHDCAHVCYPNMFRGWSWRNTAAVLSFFPTKPCGAFGGGALIGHMRQLQEAASLYFPLDLGRTCTFDYPATIQSWGIRERCQRWDADYWNQQRELYHAVEYWLIDHGFKTQIHRLPITPHLLPFKRTPELEALCKEAGLETGWHYPDLLTGEVTNITIPFWTGEVLDRLSALDQVAVRTPRARSCPS
jgi:hypothetical protein